jgi:hypothetical protein
MTRCVWSTIIYSTIYIQVKLLVVTTILISMGNRYYEYNSPPVILSIFIPSNSNTPFLLVVSSPPLTPPVGPSNTDDSRHPMSSKTFLSSSLSSFPILSLNLVILRSELRHELTSKSTNLPLPPPRFETPNLKTTQSWTWEVYDFVWQVWKWSSIVSKGKTLHTHYWTGPRRVGVSSVSSISRVVEHKFTSRFMLTRTRPGKD